MWLRTKLLRAMPTTSRIWSCAFEGGVTQGQCQGEEGRGGGPKPFYINWMLGIMEGEEPGAELQGK